MEVCAVARVFWFLDERRSDPDTHAGIGLGRLCAPVTWLIRDDCDAGEMLFRLTSVGPTRTSGEGLQLQRYQRRSGHPRPDVSRDPRVRVLAADHARDLRRH